MSKFTKMKTFNYFLKIVVEIEQMCSGGNWKVGYLEKLNCRVFTYSLFKMTFLITLTVTILLKG